MAKQLHIRDGDKNYYLRTDSFYTKDAAISNISPNKKKQLYYLADIIQKNGCKVVVEFLNSGGPVYWPLNFAKKFFLNAKPVDLATAENRARMNKGGLAWYHDTISETKTIPSNKSIDQMVA